MSQTTTTNSAARDEVQSNEAEKLVGKVCKLKFGNSIGRNQYRGRCVRVFKIGTIGFTAEMVWFGAAVNELGFRGTFPADELILV